MTRFDIGLKIANWYGKDYRLLPRWFKAFMYRYLHVYHLEIEIQHVEYPEQRVFKHMGEWWCETKWSRSRPSHTRKLAANWTTEVSKVLVHDGVAHAIVRELDKPIDPDAVKAYGEELRKIWRAPL